MRRLNKKYWPVAVRIDYSDETNSSAIKWCQDNFGSNRFRIVGSTTFYFQTEQDATFFALKWA